MKILKRIITILVMIILLLILSFNIFNFVSIKLLGNKLPTINGYAVLEVISGSMEPEISIGDMVIIDTKVNNYQVKDIVTFIDINDSFVTHRIIEINDKEVITKGDSNNTIDEAIDINQIVGRYVFKIDGFGALMKSFRSPLTLIMILIIGVISCVLVSTDSKGNVILTEEEKEYMEFLESKKNKKKELSDKDEKTKIKKVASKDKVAKTKKEVSPKKTSTKKNNVSKKDTKTTKATATKKTTKTKTETAKTKTVKTNTKTVKKETKTTKNSKK